MNDILTTQNLYKHFQGIKAIEDVNFSIQKGEIAGIFGDNGAGKTTLFNLISGFEKPDKGSIYFDGKNINHLSVLQRAKKGMGRLFQNARVFNDVSVIDNLIAASKYSTGHNFFNYIINRKKIKEEDVTNKKKAEAILDQFLLTDKKNKKAHELSVGEKKILSLGCLIMNDAEFILLDELTSGLSSIMIIRIIEAIKQLNKSNLTFLMIEHDKEVLTQLCNKTYEMQNGKLMAR